MATKAFKAQWLGDGDPFAQSVAMGDLMFVKGEMVDVPAAHPFALRIMDNPTFSVDASEDPVVTNEEDEEKAIKELLDEKGISYRANASLNTLRKLLQDAE